MQNDTFPMSQASRAARIVLDVLLTLFALIGLGFAVAVLHNADLSRPDVWVFFALMVFCAIAMLLELLHLHSRCRFTEAGLTLLRPLLPEKHFPWDAFQCVNICYRDGGRGPKPPILCFVRHGEKKNLFGRWKTANPFRAYRLIAPEYSVALHEAAKACCPLEIVDLRHTPDYIQ